MVFLAHHHISKVHETVKPKSVGMTCSPCSSCITACLCMSQAPRSQAVGHALEHEILSLDIVLLLARHMRTGAHIGPTECRASPFWRKLSETVVLIAPHACCPPDASLSTQRCALGLTLPLLVYSGQAIQARS